MSGPLLERCRSLCEHQAVSGEVDGLSLHNSRSMNEVICSKFLNQQHFRIFGRSSLDGSRYRRKHPVKAFIRRVAKSGGHTDLVLPTLVYFRPTLSLFNINSKPTLLFLLLNRGNSRNHYFPVSREPSAAQGLPLPSSPGPRPTCPVQSPWKLRMASPTWRSPSSRKKNSKDIKYS